MSDPQFLEWKKQQWRDFLLICADSFYQVQSLVVTEKAVRQVFQQWPGNAILEQVLVKVTVLNRLYNTNVFDVYRMSNHIMNLRFDERLEKGDLGLVDSVRRGHGVFTKRGNERDFYSFATKYCHWHRPDSFPIYDSFASQALKCLAEALGIFGKPLRSDQLSNYQGYKEAIDALAVRLGVADWNYKQLDKALWMYGNYKNRSNWLPMEVVKQLQDLDPMKTGGIT